MWSCCMVKIYIPGHEKTYDICAFLQRNIDESYEYVGESSSAQNIT